MKVIYIISILIINTMSISYGQDKFKANILGIGFGNNYEHRLINFNLPGVFEFGLFGDKFLTCELKIFDINDNKPDPVVIIHYPNNRTNQPTTTVQTNNIVVNGNNNTVNISNERETRPVYKVAQKTTYISGGRYYVKKPISSRQVYNGHNVTPEFIFTNDLPNGYQLIEDTSNMNKQTRFIKDGNKVLIIEPTRPKIYIGQQTTGPIVETYEEIR